MKHNKFAVFSILGILLLVACVVMNKNLRSGIKEEAYEDVTVQVLDVKEVYSSLNKYTSGKNFSVEVSYQFNNYKLKGVPSSYNEYEKYKKLIGKETTVCLYNGDLYTAKENITTWVGKVYVVCLGLEMICIFMVILHRPRKQQ